jgi:hypothetical protein
MNTVAPAATRPRTISSPKPWAPPVTRAILPSTTLSRPDAPSARARDSMDGVGASAWAPLAPPDFAAAVWPSAWASEPGRRLHASSRLEPVARSRAAPGARRAKSLADPGPDFS